MLCKENGFTYKKQFKKNILDLYSLELHEPNTSFYQATSTKLLDNIPILTEGGGGVANSLILATGPQLPLEPGVGDHGLKTRRTINVFIIIYTSIWYFYF